MRIKINPNKEVVAEMRKKLDENYNKFGKPYCPGRVDKDDERVCMCKEFLYETKDGYCDCGLYYKLKD